MEDGKRLSQLILLVASYTLKVKRKDMSENKKAYESFVLTQHKLSGIQEKGYG